jgi:large subunit ribosomal protein L29
LTPAGRPNVGPTTPANDSGTSGKEDRVMTKPAELRDQTDEQLDLLLKEVQNNLFRLRLQSETERLEAPSEIVKAKREIARIKTILRLREIDQKRSAPAPLTSTTHDATGGHGRSRPR